MGGKKYAYYPAPTDRKENGTLSLAQAAGGKVRLVGVYHYDGVLFVIDETLKGFSTPLFFMGHCTLRYIGGFFATAA